MTITKERKRRTKQAKVKLGKLTFHRLDWLEWITLGVGLWFLLYPKPYTLLFAVLLVIPILGLILNGLTGKPSIASLVEISQDENGNDKYDVADFIDFAALVLLVRVLLDFEFESFYSLILPGTIAFVAMLVVLFSTHSYIVNSQKSKVWIYASLIFNICLYSYAGAYGVNCVFDNSEPTVYEAEVLDKRISRGSKGRKTYYIEVTPWGHHRDREEISVARGRHEEIQVGQTVKIDLKEGLLGIPWYFVE